MSQKTLKDSYKPEYENKYIAVNMHTSEIIDTDTSFKKLYDEIPASTRERLMFFFILDKKFNLINSSTVDLWLKR